MAALHASLIEELDPRWDVLIYLKGHRGRRHVHCVPQETASQACIVQEPDHIWLIVCAKLGSQHHKRIC